MENYEAFVGFDLCKIPLSSVAQKIMSAMHSGDLVESENWRESEKSDQPSGVSIKFCPQSSSIRVTDQLSAEQNQKGISSSAPSRCSVPQCDQQASVLQQMERKRKHLPKEHITNENNRESMNLTGKHISCNHSSAKASKLVILEEDAGEVETYLNSRNSQALKTDFCDIRHLDALEKSQLIEMLKQAATVVVTLMYKDGSTQLRADQALVSSVKGIVMLLRSYPEEDSGPLAAPASDSFPEDMPSDQCIYIKTEHSSIWGQEQEAHQQFAKNMLREVLERKRPVTCFNAKDFVRTVLQFFGDDGSWKCVADFVGLDPRIAAWLIDPSDAAPSFEDLVAKYLGNPTTLTVNSVDGNSSRKTVHVVSAGRGWGPLLCRFQSNTMSFLPLKQACGLWQLFWTLELPLIPILAVMETHRIRVNKEEMERTSALLEGIPRLQELKQDHSCLLRIPLSSIIHLVLHPSPASISITVFITLTSIDILIYCLPIQEHEIICLPVQETWSFYTMLNRSGNSKHPCLFPDLRDSFITFITSKFVKCEHHGFHGVLLIACLSGLGIRIIAGLKVSWEMLPSLQFWGENLKKDWIRSSINVCFVLADCSPTRPSAADSNGDCNFEIKTCLLLGRKAMTNLDSILKSRDITLLTQVQGRSRPLGCRVALSCAASQLLLTTSKGGGNAILPCLLHCRQLLYQLSHKGSPPTLEWGATVSSGVHGRVEQKVPRSLTHPLPLRDTHSPHPQRAPAGCIVTADEPTVTHHRPQSAACSSVTRCHVVSDRRTRTGVHCCSIAQRGSPPETSCFPCSSSPRLLATTVSIVLSFPEYHVGIIYYVAFSDLILSASEMRLRFFHVFS
ncbi:hypothetical protein FD754_019650 [Muntiacus muntjak]|uniref:DNA polymerase nu pseudo-exo domain-containing protein n=1 Tax=Muntiacus muntjak TaxID=9888 RepID=A0A5N3V0R6_MUNMU|nr:hypothetical protein FD754_019650 [Muntiacus muntjak]